VVDVFNLESWDASSSDGAEAGYGHPDFI
jgi:hypothetical protein